MAFYEPWHGCHRYSDGCKFCYIHKGDYKRGIDTDKFTISPSFHNLIKKKKNGEYLLKSGKKIYMCFCSDFFLPEADSFRPEVWSMIKTRKDLNFFFLTKRIDRFPEVIPQDWGLGYENVTIGCTVENQLVANYRLSLFNTFPIKHKNIILQPLLEEVDISDYLKDIELVVVGGESDKNARPLNYDWVLKIREQCIKTKTPFQFRQCGTHFIKDGKLYTIPTKLLSAQAKKANIDYQI